jgi:hypothetical protein
MLVLLSSAAPNRPRYADDIVRVLALPPGAQMQFRYDRRWVAPSVIAQIPREQLADEPILICFLAADSGPHGFEILPIRFARLIRAELVGTSCLLIFEARDFVDEIDDSAVRAAVSTSIRAKLPGPSPASDALFAFECTLPTPPPPGGMNLGAFENSVTRLSKFQPFSTAETMFFTVIRLHRLGKFSWFGSWPRTKSPNGADMGTYVVAGGKRYEFEIYCLRPNEPPAGGQPPKLRLTIDSEDDQLTFVSATHGEVDSKYDVKRFVFRSDPGVFDRLTGIRVSITNVNDGTTQREIALPILLRRNVLLGEVKFLLVGLATAITGLLAATAANKLTPGTATLIGIGGFLAGVAAVFPSVKKP